MFDFAWVQRPARQWYGQPQRALATHGQARLTWAGHGRLWPFLAGMFLWLAFPLVDSGSCLSQLWPKLANTRLAMAGFRPLMARHGPRSWPWLAPCLAQGLGPSLGRGLGAGLASREAERTETTAEAGRAEGARVKHAHFCCFNECCYSCCFCVV